MRFYCCFFSAFLWCLSFSKYVLQQQIDPCKQHILHAMKGTVLLEQEEQMSGSVLVLAGVALFSLTMVSVRLCFGFVLNTGLIIKEVL